MTTEHAELPAATVSYLVNPAGKAHRRGGHKAKRSPPKGYRSWKAYMDHIRSFKGKPGAHHVRAKGKRASGGKGRGPGHARGSTALTKTRTIRELVIPLKPKRNPPRGARRRGGFIMEELQHAGRVGVAAGMAITGELGARGLRAVVTKDPPGSLKASAVEVATALVGGAMLRRFVNPTWGEFFALGGVMAPLRSFIQARQWKWVSSTLGDDGFLVGPGTDVILVSAHPGDYVDAVNGNRMLSAGNGAGDYVTGPGGLRDYVTGPRGMGDYTTGPDNNGL